MTVCAATCILAWNLSSKTSNVVLVKYLTLEMSEIYFIFSKNQLSSIPCARSVGRNGNVRKLMLVELWLLTRVR